MKSFLKTFAIVGLSIFLVVSFIRFSLDVSAWTDLGRGAFTFFTLLFSALYEGIINADNNQ